MESVDYKQALHLAVQKINKQQTFWQVMANLNYFFMTIYFNFFFKFKIYTKTFKIITFSMLQNKKEYSISQPTTLTFYDDGMTIDGYFIKYEYIINFEAFKDTGYVKMSMFGLIENDNNVIRINNDTKNGPEPVITVFFKVDYPVYFVNVLRCNMFYHIKYNKIELSAVDKFNKL